MKIMVNGTTEVIERPMTILEFLQERQFDTKLLVVEWNFTTPPRDEWDKIRLTDGDNLEIIRIIGGG